MRYPSPAARGLAAAVLSLIFVLVSMAASAQDASSDLPAGDGAAPTATTYAIIWNSAPR